MLTRRPLGTVLILARTLLTCFPILAAAKSTFDCVFDTECAWKPTISGADPLMPSQHATYYPGRSVPGPDPCYYKAYPQLDPGPARNGHDPQRGRLWDTCCSDALTIEHNDPGGGNVIVPRYMGCYYVPDGGRPAGGPSIDPMSLVHRAAGKLTNPTPEPHFGPDADKVAVKTPVCLWVDYDGPNIQTATTGTPCRPGMDKKDLPCGTNASSGQR